MDTPLISVIVPVYRVEEYLDRCVESIVAQSYQNLEIILVDDGSPDNCPAMCDAWAERDQRIRVVHKENGGLSDARNAGLAVAEGEYIGFVDSDDWIGADFYRVLIETAVQNNCELVECCYFWTYGETPPLRPVPEPQFYNKHEAMSAYLNKSAFHCVVWNKLYHRSIITAEFMCGKYHEDEFWTYQILANCNRLAHIPVYFYYYFQRSDSIMGQGYSMKRLHAIEAKANRLQFIKEHFPELEGENSVEVIFACLYHGQLALRHLAPLEQKEAFLVMKQLIVQTHIPYRLLISKKLTHRIWLTLSRFSLPLTCRIRNLFGIGM